jgi:hypothetical protein
MARSTSVVPPGPFSIADDSRMSEDYLLSDDVLIDAASPNPLAAAQMPGGRWTALAVVPGTGLVHVIPEPNSQSGWDLLPMPSGGAAREVVTAVDGAGVSHAFYQDGAFTYHSSLGSAGTWSVPDQLPAAASLTVASIPLTSEPVAAGVTPAGDLLLVTLDWASGKWQASTVDMNKALVGAEAVLTMIDDQNWTLAAVAGGQLQFFSGQGSTLAAGPFTVTTAHPVTRIHSAYQRSGSVMVMISDDQNTLYTSFGFSDQVTVIPNATVVQGAAVIDTALPPKIHFYGADQQGRLWVLHQTGWDANEAPVWAPILPLDQNVAWVASPQSALAGATLFAAGVDQTLHALAQNPATKLWKRSLVQQPASKPYPLTRYRTQLTVTDPNGNPAPGVAVTIGATEEVAILASGKTYFVGPGEQTARISTNAAGMLTLSTAATSLVSPSYTVSVPGSGAARTVRPAQNYHDLLSGTSGINTGSAVIPPMSETTLQNATVAGQPLLSKSGQSQAGWAATNIKSAMASVPGGSAAIRAAGYAGWSMDAHDPGHPQFRYFSTQADLRAHQGKGLSAGRVSQPGDADDIGTFFGDLLRAIESAVADLVSLVVDAVDALITFAIKVADQVFNGIVMVIRTIEDAVPFIHAIFNFIGALVDKVLDWLKDLFGWDQIWNTKLVFEHLAGQAIPALQWAIGQRAAIETGTWFADLKSTVDGEFETAISHFAGQSFSQISTPSSFSRSAVRTRSPGAGVPTGSAAQNNWLMSKATDNVGGSNALAPLSGTVADGLVDAVWDALTSHLDELENALADLGDFFATLFTDPKDFATRGVSDLVKAAQAVVDFVLDTLDAMVSKILDLLDGALGIADDILTQSLGDIPVVSWLYTNVVCPSDQPEEPSILRLVCLILALPVTLVYKAANQNNPPFDDVTTQQILAWRFTPPGPAEPGPAFPARADAASFAHICTIISTIQACADAAADGMSAAEDSPLVTVVDWFDMVVSIVMQVLSWPTWPPSFNWDWPKLTEGQQLTRAAWLAGWWQILVDLALLVRPSPQQGALAENDEPAGKIFDTQMGAVTLGLGLAGAIKGLSDNPPTTNGYDVASAVLGSLPLLTTYPLLADAEVEASEGVTVIIKAFLDILCDIGSAVTAEEG